MRQTMIRQSSAHLMKVIMPPPQRIQKSVEGRDVRIAGFFQPRHPGIKFLRCVHLQGFVGAKRRIHSQLSRRRVHRLVRSQVIARVIRSTFHPHPEFLQNPPRGQFARQQSIRSLPNRLRVLFTK